MQKLLYFSGLTGTSIHALSKLNSNPEVAEDIISVIQSALSQFNCKGVDTDSVEVTVNVRCVSL